MIIFDIFSDLLVIAASIAFVINFFRSVYYIFVGCDD